MLKKDRRCQKRNINGTPKETFFKPNGIPASDLEKVNLEIDEFEALRLKNVEKNDQNRASVEMNISQSTFGRILNSAYEKISDAIVNGKAIKINKK